MGDENRKEVSRRTFLASTLAGGVAFGTERQQTRATGTDEAELERILAEYGSELGELRRVR